MNTKLTFGSFEIEIREDNTTNQFLQELLNYTYKNILKEATNDSQLINIFFEYFHKDPKYSVLETLPRNRLRRSLRSGTILFGRRRGPGNLYTTLLY